MDTLVFPWQYHATSDLYFLFIHLFLVLKKGSKNHWDY